MLTLRQRLFIIVGIVAAIVTALLIFMFVIRTPRPGTLQLNTTSTQGILDSTGSSNDTGFISQIEDTETIQNRNPEDIYLEQLARMFAERVGSYSNQNENIHIDDVMPLASPQMQEWLVTQKKNQSENYEGATVYVLSMHLETKNEDRATVRIGAREELSKFGDDSGMITQVNQKKGRVELVKIEGVWKVDGLYWD